MVVELSVREVRRFQLDCLVPFPSANDADGILLALIGPVII